jgi:hypothetical protein
MVLADDMPLPNRLPDDCWLALLSPKPPKRFPNEVVLCVVVEILPNKLPDQAELELVSLAPKMVLVDASPLNRLLDDCGLLLLSPKLPKTFPSEVVL